MSKEDKSQARYYRKKKNTTVSAVQINLDTEGFTYEKWGGQQRCHRGDWLVDTNDDCYTVSDSSFKRTYRQESPGRYVKHTLIRATKACVSGKLRTQEGETAYSAGDYLIDNNDDGSDAYAVSEQKFHELYELVEDHDPD